MHSSITLGFIKELLIGRGYNKTTIVPEGNYPNKYK